MHQIIPFILMLTIEEQSIVVFLCWEILDIGFVCRRPSISGEEEGWVPQSGDINSRICQGWVITLYLFGYFFSSEFIIFFYSTDIYWVPVDGQALVLGTEQNKEPNCGAGIHSTLSLIKVCRVGCCGQK